MLRVVFLWVSIVYAALFLGACATSDPAEEAGGPEIALSGEEGLRWDLEIGEVGEGVLTIANAGQKRLEFTIGSEASWLQIEPRSGRVAAEESTEVVISATCLVPGEHREQLRIETNDSRWPLIEVRTTLQCADYPSGELAIDIDGLPDSVQGRGIVTGEDFETEFQGSTTLSELRPGEYRLVAEEVTLDGKRYRAPEVIALVESARTTTVRIEYLLDPGALEVTIEGLPGGLAHNVTLVDAQGQESNLPQSGTISALRPGRYELVVGDVVSGPRIYSGAALDIEVLSGETTHATVTYELVPGTLHIGIEGLEGQLEATVQITGQGGFSEFISGPEILVEDLVPGTFTVAFLEVQSQGRIYRVDEAEVVVEVASAQTAQLTGLYAVVPGTVHVSVVELGASDFAVVLQGPEGFSTVLDEEVVLEGLLPGAYTTQLSAFPVDGLGNVGRVVVDPASFELQSEAAMDLTISVAAATLVTSASSDGPGSFRQVVEGVAGGSTVQFAANIDEVTVTTDVTINKELTIEGRSDQPVMISGNGTRLFTLVTGAQLVLRDLVLRNGQSGEGGAVRVGSGAELVALRTDFRDNIATGSGGALFVANGASVLLEDAHFRGNSAESHGGAIAMGRTVGASSTLQIERSLFESNTSFAEGGALSVVGQVMVLESTFAHNTASTLGGALRVWDGTTTLVGVTISENNAQSGGGLHYFGDSLTAVELGRSIIAANAASGSGADVARSVPESDVHSLGHNVVGVGAAGLSDGVHQDQVGSEAMPLLPQLGPLLDNGGRTRTMWPLFSSPARAAVPAAACDEMASLVVPLRDQRGVRRPAGGFCNAGAVELDAQTETFEAAAMSTGSYQSGSFVGVQGVTWHYDGVRRETGEYAIEGQSLILRQASHQAGPGSLQSEALTGTLSSLSFQVRKAFTSSQTRQVEVRVNGEVVGTSLAFDDSTVPYPVYRVSVSDLDIDGTFTIEIRNLGAQVSVDNLTWR